MFKNIKNKKKLIIIASVVVLACIIGILLSVLIPKTDVIEYEIYYDGIKGEGIIFRDEVFYDLNGYEKVYYENVVDGQQILKNTPIASAYKKGYIKATLQKLFETEKSIVTYQNQNVITGFDDKNIQQLDFEIEVTIKQMSEKKDGYIELHNTLADLMYSRQEYIRSTYNTESNAYLQGLYSDELSMIESLKTWCDQLIASDDGYISFYCDGQEQKFNGEKAQSISYDEFRDEVERTYTDDHYGFKIVKDGKWYALVETDDGSAFQTGNYYPVYINNETQSEAGYLEKIIENRKGDILVFSFDDNIEKYLDIRTANIFIGNRFEGFAVDSEYIKNGVAIVKKDKEKHNIEVNVLYENDDIVIFDTTNELALGQKVYK